MRADRRRVAAALALGATFAGIGYAAFAIVRLRAFGRRTMVQAEHSARVRTERSGTSVPTTRSRHRVTVLKPVRGAEPGLAENLHSFCAQDYPDFHVVLGVLSPDDEALDVIQRVAAEFPDRTTVVAGDGVARFRNPKIATLAPMIAHATGEILVIADSDMRVTPVYLDAVVEAFADERVGAVTCIYCGEPAADDVPSTLGAMWITEQFAPAALVAAAVEPMTYCFGGTMAVRASVFAEIGGLAALGNQLADDATLGRLVTERGYGVALANYVVTNVVSESGLRGLLQHELRWARTIRSVRPLSYAGLIVTFPVPLAALALALARRRRTPAFALVASVLARLALHAAAHRALATRRRPRAVLTLLRDVLGMATWCAGFCGRTVLWRDQRLDVRQKL
ncbi:MAG: bacteriohopanetetrol glucosamine biosynthesis glycosyltransferase HpnI [Candidatus Eremiobacteraeota bacterium]|nr:bacteriohopanetetrol glucosamine biosynthesis glycosyltransferase HpnI [Candidatus Eremiobacteraeota bacterium]